MEKRHFARTALISDFRTEFRLGGQTYTDIHVSDIGARGCCLQLPLATVRYLKTTPMLENMILLHGKDRKYSLKGKVAWMAEDPAPRSAWVKAGVEFLETPEECSQELEDTLTTARKG